jgi:hypothetical protein
VRISFCTSVSCKIIFLSSFLLSLDLVEIDNVVMYNLNIFDHYLYEFLLDGHDHLKSPEHMIVTFLREERGHGVDGESPPFPYGMDNVTGKFPCFSYQRFLCSRRFRLLISLSQIIYMEGVFFM